jgi:CelD/BcsL family acetyltransferase involved in cellulose biosynthesis
MVTLEEVPVEEFRQLRTEWNTLVAASGSDTPFLRHEWYTALLEALPGMESTPLMLRIRSGESVLGYAPLMLRRRTRWGIPIQRLHFLGAQLTEFADLVVAESSGALVADVFRALQRWGWLEFVGHYIGASSPRLPAYAELAQRWRGAALELYEPCWYIPVAGRTWEQYCAEEAGREFVLRGVRRRAPLYERVEWAVEEYTTASPALLSEVVRLHALSQQRKGRVSLFMQDASYRAFLERVSLESSRCGWWQLFVLRIQGQWAAFVLGFVYGGVFYWWLQGFDPAYERFAPTKVLLWHVLQRGFRQRRWQEFNFMGGDTEYKRHWAKQCRWFYRLRLPNWQGLAGWLNRWRCRQWRRGSAESGASSGG